MVDWLIGWLVESLRSQTCRVPIVPFNYHRYRTKERMIERVVGSVERLGDSHSDPRLGTVIGKEIERMIERWRRDWIGFGERGAREHESR